MTLLDASPEELERLGGELETKEEELRRLQEDHNRSLLEISQKQKQEAELTQQRKQQHQAIKELEHELTTKNDLVRYPPNHSIRPFELHVAMTTMLLLIFTAEAQNSRAHGSISEAL